MNGEENGGYDEGKWRRGWRVRGRCVAERVEGTGKRVAERVEGMRREGGGVGGEYGEREWRRSGGGGGKRRGGVGGRGVEFMELRSQSVFLVYLEEGSVESTGRRRVGLEEVDDLEVAHEHWLHLHACSK